MVAPGILTFLARTLLARRRANIVQNKNGPGPNQKGLGPDASGARLLGQPREWGLGFGLGLTASVIGCFSQTHEHRHDPGVALTGLGINEKPVRQK
jgi:hypothetical protein